MFWIVCLVGLSLVDVLVFAVLVVCVYVCAVWFGLCSGVAIGFPWWFCALLLFFFCVCCLLFVFGVWLLWLYFVC